MRETRGGIRRLRAEHPEVDLIIMDDGFQHRYVEPKINVVMIDATRPRSARPDASGGYAA